MQVYRPSKRHGFTLIELLVVIAIIAILAAILFPVFAATRDKARQTQCLSNMKQIGTALQQYVNDFDETTPPVDLPGIAGTGAPMIWSSGAIIGPYLKATEVFHCPADSGLYAPAAGTKHNGFTSTWSSYMANAISPFTGDGPPTNSQNGFSNGTSTVAIYQPQGYFGVGYESYRTGNPAANVKMSNMVYPDQLVVLLENREGMQKACSYTTTDGNDNETDNWWWGQNATQSYSGAHCYFAFFDYYNLRYALQDAALYATGQNHSAGDVYSDGKGLAKHYGLVSNYLFADGHTKALKPAALMDKNGIPLMKNFVANANV